MEGPSLVIAVEEFSPFRGLKVLKADGTAKLPWARIKGSTFGSPQSWGKHLILKFGADYYRIHFLMFGSYRIDNPRLNRHPKMDLTFKTGKAYFYSCAIAKLEQPPLRIYDWTTDLMSDRWSPRKAAAAVKKLPSAMVCDVLMDQDIFAGLGNIMKNEILYNLALHPETRVGKLEAKGIAALVKESRAYALQFYKWKKINQLKRNWRIFRKKTCPVCDGKVTKKPTGKLKRISHFCRRCQKL